MVEIVPFDEHWNALIVDLPWAHLLQTREWAMAKADVGWQPESLIWRDPASTIVAAALVLTRTIRLFRYGPKVSISYIPRGPMLDWNNKQLRQRVVKDLESYAKKKKVLFLKIDPTVKTGTGVPGKIESHEDENGQSVVKELNLNGWRFSSSQVQFRNTVLLDLNGNEEDWLKRMKQKTRYNLRLAQKSGVRVRLVTEKEFTDLYKMYAETSVRDGFVIRSQEYYLNVWQAFAQAGMMSPMAAEVDGKMVAGLMLFHFGRTAWYLYGMSSVNHREKMPNYLLQWEAMRLARQKGCEVYDLWGAPDDFSGSDSMAGVFRFKEGLGGEVLRTCGAWDYVVSLVGYTLYEKILPKVLAIMRRNRRTETQQEVMI